jgi:hypothetical protein
MQGFYRVRLGRNFAYADECMAGNFIGLDVSRAIHAGAKYLPAYPVGMNSGYPSAIRFKRWASMAGT